MKTEQKLIILEKPDEKRALVLRASIGLWAGNSTGVSSRRRSEVVESKKRVVEDFFAVTKKEPQEVDPIDVRNWCDWMKREGKSEATIYARVSFLSSFYRWALGQTNNQLTVGENPTLRARPRRHKPYQTEATKAWTDEDLQALTEIVAAKAAAGELVGKRDLALLYIFTSTGLRREEVISLRGKDVQIKDENLVITGRVKGGRYRSREVNDPEVKKALLEYLTAAKRLHTLKTDAPLWTRHDQHELAGGPLTSHAFAKNLKRYASLAGLGHVHLHQTRHTYARIVAEETGSMRATQDALDHRDLSTTSAYVQRIAVKKDLHSAAIAQRRKRLVKTDNQV